MNDSNTVKRKLYKACLEFVNQRAEMVNDIITSNQKALTSETKSSAGDKHETGRAMLQLEMEKASQQLEVVYSMKIILSRINTSENSDVIRLGSLVVTDIANYYLSISAGELIIDEKIYYAVSTNSPIGKLLLGRKTGDKFKFNKEIKIIKIY